MCKQMQYACRLGQAPDMSCIYHMIFARYLKQIEDKYVYMKPVFVSFTTENRRPYHTRIWYGLLQKKVIRHPYRVDYVSDHVIRMPQNHPVAVAYLS